MAAPTTLLHPLYELTAMPVFTSLAILTSALCFSSSVVSIFFPVLSVSEEKALRQKTKPVLQFLFPSHLQQSHTGGELQLLRAVNVIYVACSASTTVGCKQAVPT